MRVVPEGVGKLASLHFLTSETPSHLPDFFLNLSCVSRARFIRSFLRFSSKRCRCSSMSFSAASRRSMLLLLFSSLAMLSSFSSMVSGKTVLILTMNTPPRYTSLLCIIADERALVKRDVLKKVIREGWKPGGWSGHYTGHKIPSPLYQRGEGGFVSNVPGLDQN